MKKILVAAILLLGCISASAQKFGVGGGFINSTIGAGGENDSMMGGYVQATADLDLSGAFSVVAGLRYVYTGGEKNLYYVFDGKTQNHTIGVPVFAKVNLFNNGDLKAFLFAGPTLYYGLSSKSQVAGITINNFDRTLLPSLKPFNLTLGGGVGLDAMEAVRFTVGYDYGVTNRYKSDNYKGNSGDIRFGVTFLF